MVESTRITSKTTTNNISFYISSLQTDVPQKYHDLARGHWSIENQLHWQLDLTFGEDGSRIRTDNAPLNMNIIRKFALFLLSKHETKSSLKRKRKKASRDNSFLINILQKHNLVRKPYIRYVSSGGLL
jgi:predicted transposase YbfD/YdcC